MDFPDSLSPTCSLSQAAAKTWDVIVVGGGPSGSLAARQLATSGLDVLLVDKAAFPRRKVCGCYMNGSALATLKAVGLGDLTANLGAPSVTRVRLGTRGRTAELPLPPGAALSREALDTALAQAAINSGAEFLDRTTAKVGGVCEGGRTCQFVQGSDQCQAIAKVVLVADGVGGHSLKDCDDIQFSHAPQSLVGMAAMTDELPEDYVSGTIHMAVGANGYVGALQLENGQLDVAAALDPRVMKTSSPGEIAQQMSDQSGLPALRGLSELRWRGTSPLTRHPTQAAAARLYLIGDAAGYVEPFTGEGMSWALASGRAVAPFVAGDAQRHDSSHSRGWIRQHHRLLRSRQRMCKIITRGLRRPWLASLSIAALGRAPIVASPFVRFINRPPGLRA